MATKRLKRPRDPIALAKLIGDIATGQVVDGKDDGKNPAAVELGRRGGLKGGRVRADHLSPQQRSAAAKAAVGARWAKSKSTGQSQAEVADASSAKHPDRKPRAKLSIPED